MHKHKINILELLYSYFLKYEYTDVEDVETAAEAEEAETAAEENEAE